MQYLILRMKFTLLALLLTTVSFAGERIAPSVESIDPEELLPALQATDDFRSHAQTVRRGLAGTQITYRAESAQWFIKHGVIEDVPYLIDSLSDESMHVGASYPLAGMATTRYWANIALIVICKTSYDYQWDSTKEKREYSISLWTQHWNRVRPNDSKPMPVTALLDAELIPLYKAVSQGEPEETIIGEALDLELNLDFCSNRHLLFKDELIVLDETSKYHFVKWKFTPEQVKEVVGKRNVVCQVVGTVIEVRRGESTPGMPHVVAQLERIDIQPSDGSMLIENLGN